MNKSSMLRMKCFIDNYVVGGAGKRLLDVGSYDVNGCYKTLFSDIDIEYVGLDIEEGPNVDIVVDKLYSWDLLQDESFDYIISGQTFEHIEYPWLTIKEIYKKLKPEGIICIIAPNGLFEHRYPVDCYRYYADGMRAIAVWGGFDIMEVSVAGIPSEEVSSDWDDIWNDVCLIACKSRLIRDKFANKIIFPMERRYDPMQNLQLQYEFVSKWKYYSNKIDKLIIDYIKREEYEDIYIAGDEHTGIILAELLQSRGIDYKVIKMGGKPTTTDCLCKDEAISNINENHSKRILCIVTILDIHRTWIKEIEKQYCFSNVVYIDNLVKGEEKLEIIEQMKEYFQECPNIYIYGAGINGSCIQEILKGHGLKISGFVVSDDQYMENQSSSNIHMISDISRDSGIIISPNKDELIWETLKKLNFENCFDGKIILR